MSIFLSVLITHSMLELRMMLEDDFLNMLQVYMRTHIQIVEDLSTLFFADNSMVQ